MRIRSAMTGENIQQLGWGGEYEQFNRRFDALKEAIARVPGIERDLFAIAKGDSERRDTILELLAHIVRDLPRSWRDSLKKSQDDYRNAAKKLRPAIKSIEKIVHDPGCPIEFWLLVLNPGVTVTVNEEQETRAKLRVLHMLRTMRAYEEYALAMAKEFGRYSRSQVQLMRRREIGILIRYVRRITGRNFDEEIARLLTDAHVAVGSKKKFSTDQIKKLRQRHIPEIEPKVPKLGSSAPSHGDNSPS
jgi:hypothetical protein